jgi:hypothetical protein
VSRTGRVHGKLAFLVAAGARSFAPGLFHLRRCGGRGGGALAWPVLGFSLGPTLGA